MKNCKSSQLIQDKFKKLLKNHLVKNSDVVGAIDLGSHSFHCLLVNACDPKEVVAERRVPIRLGEGINPLTRKVRKETFSRAIDALDAFRQMLDQYSVSALNVVGTEAFRHLSPFDPFIQKAQNALKAPIRILSGIEEAYLTYRGVVNEVTDDGRHHLVLDIGGGSTEVSFGSTKPQSCVSMPIGAVELMQRVGFKGHLSTSLINRLEQICCSEMQEPLQTFKSLNWDDVQWAAGMSGLFSDLAVAWHKDHIDEAFLNKMLQVLKGGQEMSSWPVAISLEKQDLLPATLCILKAVMQHLSIKRVHASPYALRHGLIRYAMDLDKNEVRGREMAP